MRSLIVEDDATSRLLLLELLSPFGTVQAFDSGPPALAALRADLAARRPPELICLDIMLPDMDGQVLLRAIRSAEQDAGYPIGRGSKIVMTTALRDKTNVLSAFRNSCDGYLPKPIDRTKLHEQLRGLQLIA
jgi:two-component system, chemotaxis family, chemotaxis protein CheY